MDTEILPGDSKFFFEAFNEMRRERELTDFTIVSSSGKSFPVHKNVISIWSEYLKILVLRWNKETPIRKGKISSKGDENEASTVSKDNSTTLDNISSEVSSLLIGLGW